MKQKHRKDKIPEAVSQKYWRKQRPGKNKDEPLYTNYTRTLRQLLFEGGKGPPNQERLFQINLNYM